MNKTKATHPGCFCNVSSFSGKGIKSAYEVRLSIKKMSFKIFLVENKGEKR